MPLTGQQLQQNADTLAFLDRAQRGQVRFSNATGYDAVVDQGRRKRAHGINRSEDQELTPFDRFRLYTTGRDIGRNFSVAGWAIRKHLDYVSTFHFRNKTPNDGRKARFHAVLRDWSKRQNCDTAGRHSLMRLVRLIERSRTLDGDDLICKIADGRLQVVEADRLRTPPGAFPAGVKQRPLDFLHGVQTDEAGKALNYCVCRRAKASDFQLSAGMFYFERLIPADACWHHGYFDRIDQIRGVSPLAGAYNQFRDVYEGVDYALAKMKVSQLFGLKTMRDDDTPMGTVTPDPANAALLPGSQMIYDDTPDTQDFKVDFGKGPFHLDLNKDEDAEFIESKTPSAELQQFCDQVIAMALKGLDIPFSFYKENFTNFSGQRQAWIQYDLAARNRRLDNIELLDEILRWRIDLWIEDGVLDGSVEDYVWEWVPNGIPWINPLQEVQADTQALASGFTSRTRVCRERGEDFQEIAAEIAAENELLDGLGISTEVKPANVQITEIAGASSQ
jgi:capsid protein